MPLAMSVRACVPLLAAAAYLVGCGPEVRDSGDRGALIRAGLSDQWPWMGVYSVVQWDFDDDGKATVTTFGTAGACGNDMRTSEYLWSEAEHGAIEVTDLDGGPMNGGGGGSWDRAILRINAEFCPASDGVQPVDLVYFKDGQEKPSGAPGLVRGKVCLEETSPCPSGSECDGCRTMWCDGEPPEPYPCDG